jgi:D-proline reductase (dithiol) PrdB
VGLVARVVEEAGIPTVLVSTGRDLTQQVLPPRSAFVNFPMGNPFGRPFDRATQRRILLDALRLAETAAEGGTLVDLPYEWGEPFSSIVEATAQAMSPA